MREVSVDALDLVVRVAQGLGHSKAEVAEAFRLPPVPPKRIDWDDFVVGMTWLGTCADGLEGLADASARHFLEVPAHRGIVSVLRLVTSPRDFYWIAHRYGGHGLFNNGTSEFQVLGPTRVRMRLSYAGTETPPSFFALTAGALKAAPRAIGYADSAVRFEIVDNRCEYIIDHAPSESILARLRAAFLSLFSRRGVLDELEKQKLALTAQLTNLDRSHRQSEEALAMMTRFLGTVTHELRTPLGGIIGIADIMRDNPLSASEQQALILDLRSSASRLLKIVNDVVDIDASTTHDVAKRHRELALLVQSIVEPFASTAQTRSLPIEVTIDPALPSHVLLESGLLSKCWSPILDNAVRFTPRGRIEVSVSPHGSRNVLVIRVADTGPGIPMALQERIFKPFFQVDQRLTRQHGGVGLGLAVARQLARSVGGEVRLDHASDAGSVFVLEWPYDVGEGALVTIDVPMPLHSPGSVVLADASPSAPSLEVVAPVPATHRRRALVVEDNMVNQRILTKILATLDVDCDIAADGEIAIRAHSQRQYDVIFMDLQMPVMDGLQATQAIRRCEANTRHTPIVGVTANGEQEFHDRAMAAGMDYFIRKPIQRTVIADALARITTGLN